MNKESAKIITGSLADLAKTFNPNQPRDYHGRWTSGAGSFGSKDPKPASDLMSRLKEEGGFTYNVVSGDSPKPGDEAFAVSYSKTTERVLDLNKMSYRDLVKYVVDHSADLSKPDHYFGGWVDQGKAYLDCSIVKKSESDAISVAQANDQLAYFSFRDMRSIDTPKKKESNMPGEKKSADVKSPIKRFMVKPNFDSIAAMYEAMTGKKITPAERAAVEAEFGEDMGKIGKS